MTDDRCPHHTQCRADLGRQDDQLCGYHHGPTWTWCMIYQAYQSRQREERALARAGRCDSGEIESINETISHETEPA